MLSETMAKRSKSMRRVAGYTRVSRVGGRSGDGFISEADQREGIIARAAELGLTVAKWFHDPDYSGGNLQRPDWERLMERVLDEDDPICGVMVVRVDRFARTVPEGAPEVKRIWDSNRGAGIFVAVDLPLDTTTPYGRKMLWDWLSNAELQLEMMKASWWRAKRRAIERGAHIGRTPLAFERIPRRAEKNAGMLVPRPEWLTPVRRVFDYAKRHPDALEGTIARWANEHAPRPDGRRWSVTSIANMLRNRVYVGEVAYRPAPRGSRRGRGNAAFDPMVNPDAHEGIVDEATFLAAQRERRRPRTQAPSKAARVSTLRGLVRCAGCRHTLVPSRGGRGVATYRCNGETSAGRCPRPATITAARIEPWVLSQVQTQLGDVDAIGEFVSPTGSDGDDLFAAIESERARAHEDMRKITENTRLAAADPEGWLAVRHAAVATATELDDRYLAAIRAQQAPVATLLGGDFSWDDVTPEELRDIVLPAVIDCVFVRSGRGIAVEQRALILWRGQADPDLPGKGRPAPTLRSFQWPEDNTLAGVARGDES